MTDFSPLAHWEAPPDWKPAPAASGVLHSEAWPQAGQIWHWDIFELPFIKGDKGAIMRVRREGDGPDRNFFVGVERGLLLHPEKGDLADHVRLSLEQRRLGRWFTLDENGEINNQTPDWGLFLSVGGSGSWQSLKILSQYSSKPVPFLWADKKGAHDEAAILKCFLKPAQEVLDWARHEIENPDSPLGFARRWRNLTHHEHFLAGLNLNKGQFLVFVELIEKICIASADYWNEQREFEW